MYLPCTLLVVVLFFSCIGDLLIHDSMSAAYRISQSQYMCAFFATLNFMLATSLTAGFRIQSVDLKIVVVRVSYNYNIS